MRHVVITGTGRAGTTALVRILSVFGEDTSFTGLEELPETSHAGLERDVRDPDAPRWCKSPRACEYMGDLLKPDGPLIEAVVIVMRDLEGAAGSRAAVQDRAGTEDRVAGGLWDAHSSFDQPRVLENKIYHLCLGLSSAHHSVSSPRIVFLRYPLWITYPLDTWSRLFPLLENRSSGFPAFHEAMKKVVNPKLIHSYGEKDV